MSTPPSAQPPPQNKPRKKRSADVVSFEDLLAAHRTEREPGQLPPEGVVLIGVDLELQRRIAERIGLPAPTEPNPASTAPNVGAPQFEGLAEPTINVGAPTFRSSDHSYAPSFFAVAASPTPGSSDDLLDEAGTSLPNIPNSGAQGPDEPEFNIRDLLIRRTTTKSYVVYAYQQTVVFS